MNQPNNDHRQWLALVASKGNPFAPKLLDDIYNLETRITFLERSLECERQLRKGYAILLIGTLIVMGLLVSTIATIASLI
jgi:hypothetical protein